MDLINRYRPQTLSEVWGNKETVSILSKLIETKSIPHAILLHGASGTGKTTLARIIASALGVNTVGSNYIEINAAKDTGVDAARDIIELMPFMPFGESCRVFVLDECHMLSSAAQTALLKALEDSGAHNYFVLCTTDKQKLIPTLISRTLKLETSPIDDINTFADFIDSIYKAETGKEKSPISDDLMYQLFNFTGGKPRAALSEFQKILTLDDKELTNYQVKLENQLNSGDDLAKLLVFGDKANKIPAILKDVPKESIESLRYAILGYASAVLLNGKNIERCLKVIDYFQKPFYDSGKAGFILACYKVRE